MEREQFLSRFQKTPATIMTPAAKLGEAKNSRSIFQYKLPAGDDKVADLFKKIISQSYRLTDSLIGQSSFILLDGLSDYQFPRLQKILELLKSEQFIEWVSLAGTRYNDAPFFYRVDILPGNKKYASDGRLPVKALGHGFGKDAEEVFSKAIGEVLERCFVSVYRKKDLWKGSARNLKDKKLPALDLNLLVGFSEEQKNRNPRLKFNEQSVFYWGQAKRVSAGQTIYLPAQLLYWTYVHDEGEPFLGEGNTNGAGGFFTREGAILSGLYELIQRDSFLIHWLNRLTPRQIDPKSVPHAGFQELLAESERYGFEIHCLDVTADTGVPVFAAVIADPSGLEPRFCLAAGCQADPAKALYRALEEAWSVYYWMRPRPGLAALGQDYQPFRQGITQDERLRLWSNPAMAEYFKFLLAGPKEKFDDVKFDYPQTFASLKEELDFLVKKVESLGPGYEVYCHEASHPFLDQIGYHSAQVVVPPFIPLYLKETYAPLGSRRLKTVPAKLGFRAAKEFYPWPHPFP